MVYICIDTGSRAKGYAVDSSDADYYIYSKCDRETFAKYIDNKEILKNRHTKDDAGNDVKHLDLYTGLVGILTGKSPELGVFGKRQDFKDKHGIENLQLYEFVTKLTSVSMIKIINTMMKYKLLNTAKGLLQLMFNYVYVEYYLDYKRAPQSTKILNMLFNVSNEVQIAINKSNQLIINDSYVLDLNKTNGKFRIDDTLTLHVKNFDTLKLYVTLMQRRGEFRQEWVEYFQRWKQQLQDRLQYVRETPERADIRHNIVMYALDERGPVMPENENRIVNDLNKLNVENDPFDWLTCNYITDNCKATNKLDMLNILIFCYNNCEVNKNNEIKLFKKVFNLFEKQFVLNNVDYKNLYKQYINLCK
ncbi:he65 protein [Thysanoplusia orichalcea nucleopolyhedrovirus]|uniref:He65 protein n=1 Tax=Thysanoplusia orichalcea nucleopolyhedrovirus TaxID=101850 RepID=L0CM06_9ABAC|nr:he65 protein [Thysanoplusia orichalcea nucleopolyhedrovirus]AGA16256.1 he65 protein [Thysanoplusia orichalcea nucleopolyhedrovirus]